jgi:hypothetical protein
VDRRDIPRMLLASAAVGAFGLTKMKDAAAQTSSGGLLGAPIILTGSGTYTPSAAATAIYVIAVGGGGGAGGAVWNGTGSVTGGGGGGSVGAGYITPLESSYEFSCGSAGSGGAPGQGGSIGNATIFAGMNALGGFNSFGAADGQLASPGANGGRVLLMWPTTIRSTPGELGVRSGAFAVAGNGGNSPYGTGGGGRPNNGPGLAATGFGAGGGGANALSSSQNGGNGSDGVIIVWEFG